MVRENEINEWVYDFFFSEVTSVYSSGLRFEKFKNPMLLNVSSEEKLVDPCESNK